MYLKQGIFNFERGQELADIGLALATENAERKEKDWKRKCWQLFLFWLRRKRRMQDEFMIEDFREYVSEMGLLEEPPSLRAYGFISKKAVKEKWIIHAGVGKSKSVKSHSTPVNKWVRA